ncbi:curlin [uncultured Dokdonia sp.]|uniref:curlin n=1 Tax=uncultured Dokdonia sp. TaxID=575653 RepID=UPI002604829E|nr:curlin [uncultured Dokdonia sp.]
MKKVIFSVVALAVASVAMAQSPATNDTGAREAVQVAQISGSAIGANTGESIQNGSSNAVQVRQAGTSQSTLTDQNGTANLARVMQTGNVNGNQSLSGQLNFAEVEQTGFNNQSTIFQEGDYNNAMIDQNNDNDTAANRAMIMQGTANQAEMNAATIEQDGEDNSAYTLQTWDNSDASTVQSGSGNISEISQNAGPEDSQGQFAVVTQIGVDNESRVDQDNAAGSDARNVAYTAQTGNNNNAEQIQSANGSTGNIAVVAQGQGNQLFQVPASEQVWFNTLAFDPSVTDGGNNIGDSDNGVAFQQQNGDGNQGFIGQYASTVDSNNGAQLQDGNNNAAYLSQNAFGSSNGSGNIGRQEQIGDGNATGVLQTGNDHLALQVQTGNGNSNISTQRGMSNNLNIFQEGDGSYGQTIQHGENNVALLTQRDGQSYTIRQNEGVFTPGVGGNQADILQEGPLGTGTQAGFIQVTPQGVTAPHSVSSFSLAPIN